MQQNSIAPTVSEVVLIALVKQQDLLELTRRSDFLRIAIWVWRVTLKAAIDSLALRVASRVRRALCVSFVSRPLPHGLFHGAINGRDELEKFGGPRDNFGQGLCSLTPRRQGWNHPAPAVASKSLVSVDNCAITYFGQQGSM